MLMENKPKVATQTQELSWCSTPKFKQLHLQANSLQNKYDVYKTGSPNFYQENVENLKTQHPKHGLKTLELPMLNYLFVPPAASLGANHRNYDCHPSTLQKSSHKFRDLVSDHQEIRDFMVWFTKKQKEIISNPGDPIKKFNRTQTLLTSALNELLMQLACVSKPRTDLIRMIWNIQGEEIQRVIELVYRQRSHIERNSLRSLKSVHLGYQEQIIQLNNTVSSLEHKLQSASLLNEACLNSLRVFRKRLRKQDTITKQLIDTNTELKLQAVTLLQDNTRLLMCSHEVVPELARVLAYRGLVLNKIRAHFDNQRISKKMLRDAHCKMEQTVEERQMAGMEECQEKLVKAIRTRLKENANQKKYILKGEFSDDDDDKVQLQWSFEKTLQIKSVKSLVDEMCANKPNIFAERGVNTDTNHCGYIPTQPPPPITVGTQTASEESVHLHLPITKTLFINPHSEEVQNMRLLRARKVEQRHSLMMIQMNKMAEFKKIDHSGKVRKLDKFRVASPSGCRNFGLKSDLQPKGEPQQTLSEEKNIIGEFGDLGVYSSRKFNSFEQSRERTILKMHRSSFFQTTHKSTEFHNLVKNIVKESTLREEALRNKEQPTIALQRQLEEFEQIGSQVCEFREVLQLYLQSPPPASSRPRVNPEKPLTLLLTSSFRQLSLSNKSNLLEQLIVSAKHIFGAVVYESKLLQLIALMLENKECSLLSALTILLELKGYAPEFQSVLGADVGRFYFTVYFHLTLKQPGEDQFNIWNNLTSLSKLSDPDFSILLGRFLGPKKCEYIQLKIREFIGVTCNEVVDGSYYIKLNPLMMYLLEVYLLEKKSYYSSYHHMAEFLTSNGKIDLSAMLFLLDLLCFEEAEQREVISDYFGMRASEQVVGQCPVDVLYSVCLRYEVPLFEFIKLLKLEQFKKLPEQLRSDYIEIEGHQRWDRVRASLAHKLTGKENIGQRYGRILDKLDQFFRNPNTEQIQSFKFYYRVIVHTANS